MIGTATAGRDQSFVINHVVIDEALYLQKATEKGYVSSETVDDLREQLQRTQNDLNTLRQQGPDWRKQVDEAIASLNASKSDEARKAFARLDDLIRSQEGTAAQQEARSKHAQATLLYRSEASKAAPLMSEAAQLAGDNFWYWIESGWRLLDTGKQPEAEEHFLKAAGLAEQEEGRTRKQSIAYRAVGDALYEQSRWTEALGYYERSLKIARLLVEREPASAGLQREVSACLMGLGNLKQQQGNLAEAFEPISESLAIIEGLATQEPGNSSRQHDLSVLLASLGHVRHGQKDFKAALKLFERGLQISRSLAERDPGNTGWQRGLSVALRDIGDVWYDRDKVVHARDAYDEGLAIARSLASLDPTNTRWQWDLSVLLERSGKVLNRFGHSKDAIVAYEESLRIRRTLHESTPENTTWWKDTWRVYWHLAQIDRRNAASHWLEALEHLEEAHSRGLLPSSDVRRIEQARRYVKRFKGKRR